MVSLEKEYSNKADFINIDFNLADKAPKVKDFIMNYKIESHPVTFIFSKEGKLVNKIDGFNVNSTEKDILNNINKLYK